MFCGNRIYVFIAITGIDSYTLLMSMTDVLLYPDDTDFFVFYGKFILLEDSSCTQTGATLFCHCKEAGLVADSFAEPEYGYAAALLSSDMNLPEGCQAVPLRNLFAAGNPLASKAARALGLLNWRKASRFCSRCGAPLSDDEKETARRCTKCSSVVYPRISPCIIILVTRPRADGQGREMLLARHVQRNQDMYTCIAGFMECGESVEECAAREVKEETGLFIKNIRYFKSQSWPFPEQLMIGLTADYDSGEIVLQEDELSEAKWFSSDDLPNTPPPGSLAWDLIQASGC